MCRNKDLVSEQRPAPVGAHNRRSPARSLHRKARMRYASECLSEGICSSSKPRPFPPKTWLILSCGARYRAQPPLSRPCRLTQQRSVLGRNQRQVLFFRPPGQWQTVFVAAGTRCFVGSAGPTSGRPCPSGLYKWHRKTQRSDQSSSLNHSVRSQVKQLLYWANEEITKASGVISLPAVYGQGLFKRVAAQGCALGLLSSLSAGISAT